MNAALMLMAATGRNFNMDFMKNWIEKTATRRKWIFGRLADVIFSIVAFFYGKLDLKVLKGGVLVEATDAGLTVEEKLNAVIEGMKADQKSDLLRELFRPLLITGAELLAELMSPDPMLLQLFGGMGGQTAAPQINVSPAPYSPAPLAPAGGIQLRMPAGLASRIQTARANGDTVVDLGNGVQIQFG